MIFQLYRLNGMWRWTRSVNKNEIEVCFNAVSRNSPSQTEENHENRCQGRGYLG